MAKSRLSVSASRVLLGLGVVGMSATSAFAVDITSGNFHDGDTVLTSGDSGANVTLKSSLTGSNSINMTGVTKWKDADGAEQKTVGKVTLSGGNELLVHSTLGGGDYSFVFTSGTIKLANGATVNFKNAADKLAGAVVFEGGNIVNIDDDTAIGNTITSLTVNGTGNEINITKASEHFKTTGAITLNQGADLTLTGTASATDTVSGASLALKGGNTVNIGKVDLQTTNNATVSGGDNKINFTDASGKLTIGGGLSIAGTTANSVTSRADLTIKGTQSGNAKGGTVGITGGITLGGNSTITFEDVNTATAGGALAFTGGNNILNLDNTTLTTQAASVTVSGSGNQINLSGASGKIAGANALTIDSGVAGSVADLTITGDATEGVNSNIDSIVTITLGTTGGGKLTLNNIKGATGSGYAITTFTMSDVAGQTNTLSVNNSKVTIGTLNLNTNGNNNFIAENNSTLGLDSNSANLEFQAGNNNITVGQGSTVNINNASTGDATIQFSGLNNNINLLTGATLFKSADLTVGKIKKDAELTITGATKENLVLTNGIKIGTTDQDEAHSNTLTFKNSTFESKLAFGSGASAINTNTLKLENSNFTTSTDAITLGKNSNNFIEMDKNSTFTSKANITVDNANDTSKLTIKGGTFTVDDGKTLTVGGSAQDATLTLDGTTATIDTLAFGATQDKNRTITLKDSTVTVKKAFTFVNQNAGFKDVMDINNSKVTFEAGIAGGAQSGGFAITSSLAKNDASIVVTGGTTDLTKAAFKVTTDALITDSKVIARAEGEGITLGTKTGAIADISVTTDVRDFLSNQSWLADDKYINKVQVSTDGTSITGGNLASELLNGYKLELGNSNTTLTLKADAKDITTVDINKIMLASAKDQQAAIKAKLNEIQLAANAASGDEKVKLQNAYNELNEIAARIPDETMSGADLTKFVVGKSTDANVAYGAITTVKEKAKNVDLTLILAGNSNASLTKTSNSMIASGNINEANGILHSISSSSIGTDKILNYITDTNFFANVRDDAKSLSNMSDASTGVNAAISVANDMNIANRIAIHSNPYQQLSNAKRFASLNSDAAFDYYDTYKRSVWANVFGGVNIIDGENGGLIGVSAGLDSYLTDNFLLGAHLTYANSTVDDGTNEQKANSFQLGVYSLYKFAPTWELNTRASIQFAPTDLDNNSKTTKYSTDFTRTSFALGANIGKVFSIADGMYLKPFFGGNYYYTYTPGYDRGSVYNSTDDQAATSLSLELGAEFRIYASENAYFYVTPKLEQYVLNSVDDFVGGFAGSTVNYTIEAEDEKKLYGQILIGGDYQVNEALSLNAGLGVKQILANKVNDNNETFVTGNVGLKYRF